MDAFIEERYNLCNLFGLHPLDYPCSHGVRRTIVTDIITK